MSTAESQSGGFEVVVAADGSIPADELARLGIRPGTHLRVVPEPQAHTHKSIMGALTGQLDVDAFEDSLAKNKEQRITEVLRDE